MASGRVPTYKDSVSISAVLADVFVNPLQRVAAVLYGQREFRVRSQTVRHRHENGGQRREGRPGGSDSIGQERVQRMRDRLMDNPEVRQEYESRLQQDPTFATDLEKQAAFFREMMRTIRGRRQ